MQNDGSGLRVLLRSLLALTLLAMVLAARTPSVVRGQLPPPMGRRGRAYINWQGARDGTLVEVRVYGELVASDITETLEGEAGRYGYPGWLEIEGEPGDLVRYYVAGVEAMESPKDWASGYMRQDLNILQAWLAVEVTAPERVNVGAVFDVSASISNTGLVDAQDVHAVLTTSEGATLAPGQSPTQTVGTGTLWWGDTRALTWTLECTGALPVTVTVSPAGIDEHSGLPIASYNAEPDAITVEQQTPAHLVTEVLSPSPGAMVGVGDPLMVTARISNTGQADAVDVTAELTHTTGAELVSGAVQPVGQIPGGTAGMVTWTLVCTETHPVTMTVLPAGTDGNDGGPVPVVPAEVTVDPYDPPFLTTTIEAVVGNVPVGEPFTVSATITNTGLGAAGEVTALIDVQGSAVLTTTDAPTQTIGALSAGAGSVLAWAALVTDTGPITVTVVPDGVDAASGHPIPEARRPPGILVLPQHRYHLILMPFFRAAQ
jgi:hypothetical protein